MNSSCSVLNAIIEQPTSMCEYNLMNIISNNWDPIIDMTIPVRTIPQNNIPFAVQACMIPIRRNELWINETNLSLIDMHRAIILLLLRFNDCSTKDLLSFLMLTPNILSGFHLLADTDWDMLRTRTFDNTTSCKLIFNDYSINKVEDWCLN